MYLRGLWHLLAPKNPFSFFILKNSYMYKEAEFQVWEAYLTSFPSYEQFSTPVSLRFIHWPHAEWRRRRPMQLCYTLLCSLDNYQPLHNTDFVPGKKKAYRHVLTRWERYKYLLRTACVTNSKRLTLLQPSLHVVNDARPAHKGGPGGPWPTLLSYWANFSSTVGAIFSFIAVRDIHVLSKYVNIVRLERV